MHTRFLSLSSLLAVLALVLVALSAASCESSVSASPASGATADLSTVRGVSTLSADFVNKVLSAASSPAAGLGQVISDLSTQYGIDDAWSLAFFGHESSFGTAGVAVSTRSWGNIICTSGWPRCTGRFRAYDTWRDGLLDFLKLLTQEYFPAGLTTIQTIVPRWAPSSDGNAPTAYIQALQQFVSAWRKGQLV